MHASKSCNWWSWSCAGVVATAASCLQSWEPLRRVRSSSAALNAKIYCRGERGGKNNFQCAFIEAEREEIVWGRIGGLLSQNRH
jgi:hypothetical protein